MLFTMQARDRGFHQCRPQVRTISMSSRREEKIKQKGKWKGNGVDVSSEATIRSFSFGMMNPCRTQAMCAKANFLQGHLILTGDFHLPEWGKKTGNVHLRWKTWAWEVLGNSYPV